MTAVLDGETYSALSVSLSLISITHLIPDIFEVLEAGNKKFNNGTVLVGLRYETLNYTTLIRWTHLNVVRRHNLIFT
jgi:hypothetical protein